MLSTRVPFMIAEMVSPSCQLNVVRLSSRSDRGIPGQPSQVHYGASIVLVNPEPAGVCGNEEVVRAVRVGVVPALYSSLKASGRAEKADVYGRCRVRTVARNS